MNWPILLAHLGATWAFINAFLIWQARQALSAAEVTDAGNLAIPVLIAVLFGAFGIYAGIAVNRAPDIGSWQLLAAGLLGIVLMWIPFLLVSGLLYLAGGVVARRGLAGATATEASEQGP